MSASVAGDSGSGPAAAAAAAANQQPRHQPISTQSYKIITQFGDMLIVKQGAQQQAGGAPLAEPAHAEPAAAAGKHQHQARPVIMTFHDLGLNSELQFATFCECDEVKLMLQTFTMIHVNFVGQEFAVAPAAGAARAAADLPDDFRYPTVEQLAECVVDICAQMRVRSFIGLAVGAGAHIVGSLALLRPDLVHGLFLINPVVSSCSITEWLYFKMSAIAGNHQPSGGGGGGQAGADESADGARESPPHAKHQHQHQQQPASQTGATSGLRRFLSAAARLPHFHHHHHNHQRHQHHAQSQARRPPAPGEPDAEPAAAADDADQRSLDSTSTSASLGSGRQSAAGAAPHASRLRQLILSRNFKQQLAADQPAKPSDAQSDCSAASEQSAGASRWAGQRPPLEYLMYHHFGSASFQRYRRPSLQGAARGSASESGSPVAEAAGREADPLGESSSLSSGAPVARAASVRRASGGATGSAGSGGGASPSASLLRRRQQHASPAESRSQGSLAGLAGSAGSPRRTTTSTTRGGGGGGNERRHAGRHQRRSNSVCLSASHLASFASERQRLAYVQAVYRQYFCQLNAHNLWLFAQSFVKRRTLNLRKDCGAAAHAAAAAAALGTSICAAFVGGDPRQQVAAAESVAEPGCPSLAGGLGAAAGAATAPLAPAADQVASAAQALVAGTKVKRTFTCQTLVMCSSVQIHCERALKLMALLNPLQATWIKTDQLLVLEERPEKVCQALRLFLQGIGYSMSTYERRLRLSSAHGSASSADSASSARSLNGANALQVL